MTLPGPDIGLVIRYSFLWGEEADVGQEEGRKDRPCAIVLIIDDHANETKKVYVVPITHTEPVDDATALEIPKAIKKRLGLDEEQSWIITRELNSFIWPGPDLRTTGSSKAKFTYGYLPLTLTNQIIDRIKEHVREGSAKVTSRTE